MASQIPVFNPPILKREETNAWLPALQQGISAGLQTRFAPRMAESELARSNLANELAQMNLKYAPREKENALEKEHLANALSKMQLSYYPEVTETELARKNASIPLMNSQARRNEFNLENPLLHVGGIASQLGSIEFLEKNGHTDYANVLRNNLANELKKNQELVNYYGKRNTSYEFGKMPKDRQDYEIGKLVNLGMSDQEATKRLLSGEQGEEIASSLGVSPEEYQKTLPTQRPTATTRNREQLAATANAELNAVSEDVNAALGFYPSTIKQYSPEQLLDQLRGKNDAAQQRYMAAIMIYPEIESTRLRSMGAQVGEGAMERLLETSMAARKVLQAKMKSENFIGAQRQAEKWINRMREAGKKTNLGNNNSRNKSNESINNEEFQNKINDMSDEQIMQMIGEQ